MKVCGLSDHGRYSKRKYLSYYFLKEKKNYDILKCLTTRLWNYFYDFLNRVYHYIRRFAIFSVFLFLMVCHLCQFFAKRCNWVVPHEVTNLRLQVEVKCMISLRQKEPYNLDISFFRTSLSFFTIPETKYYSRWSSVWLCTRFLPIHVSRTWFWGGPRYVQV